MELTKEQQAVIDQLATGCHVLVTTQKTEDAAKSLVKMGLAKRLRTGAFVSVYPVA